MKKLLSLCVILSLTIYFGCSNNLVSPPISNASNSGQVTLKISGNNAPSNVKQLTAILTRSGADTLVSNSNPLTDTTGEINFTNVPAGVWHLTVLAADSMGTIIYRGENDINVESGVSINVSLTLIPVTNGGTGSISITVNWGAAQPLFVDYSFNPVFTIYQNPSIPNSVSEAKILYDNGIYKMWYLSGYNSAHGNIWYAESSDGINWINKSNGPVLDTDSLGSWDGLTVGGGTIIKDGNIYKMYFNGVNSPYGRSQIGYATSYDGVHWQKYPYPVLQADSSQKYHLGTESVIKVNGVYYMYYQSSPVNNYNLYVINLAVSNDGINWTNYENNPIMTPTLSWEGVGITYASVIYDSNEFIMVYQSMNRDAFGIAYSTDGKHWVKKYQKPVFTKQDAVQNYLEINYPFFIKVGNEYRIYYTGEINTIRQCISFARSYNIQ